MPASSYSRKQKQQQIRVLWNAAAEEIRAIQKAPRHTK
jgi:hypothetical protein